MTQQTMSEVVLKLQRCRCLLIREMHRFIAITLALKVFRCLIYSWDVRCDFNVHSSLLWLRQLLLRKWHFVRERRIMLNNHALLRLHFIVMSVALGTWNNVKVSYFSTTSSGNVPHLHILKNNTTRGEWFQWHKLKKSWTEKVIPQIPSYKLEGSIYKTIPWKHVPSAQHLKRCSKEL